MDKEEDIVREPEMLISKYSGSKFSRILDMDGGE